MKYGISDCSTVNTGLAPGTRPHSSVTLPLNTILSTPRTIVIPSGSVRAVDNGIVVMLKTKSDEFCSLYQLLPENTLDAFHICVPIPYVQSGLSVT